MIWVPPPDGWEQGRTPARPPAWLPAQRTPHTGRTAPPSEVLGAFADLGPGGNWEGGTVDKAGRLWIHEPYTGWRPAGPRPYLADRGRVYTATGVRRHRRRETVVELIAPPVGMLAGALICGGLVNSALGWAIAGAGVAAVLAALIGWGFSGRPR